MKIIFRFFTRQSSACGLRSALLLGLLGTAPAAFGQLTFAPRVDYPSLGTNPYGVAAGDLNGDGRPDVVAANASSGNVSVFLGQASVGTLGSATVYAAGGNSLAVALGDVNGDGRLDIVTANSNTNDIGVLLGSTTTPGTFQPATTYAAGNQPRTVALGDVNGDGRLDVVVANFNSNTVTVLLNSAATPGTFATTAAYVGAGSSSSGAVLGDVNGDGRLDIVTSSNTSGTVGVLLNLTTAPGTFGAVGSYASGTGSPFNLTLGDMNNDGRLDIVAGSLGSGSVGVLLNSAATPGTFAAATAYSTGMGSTIELAVGDLNGDGRLDVAAGGSFSSDAVGTLLGSPATAGALVSPQVFSTGSGSQTRGVAVYDLNGDGLKDIIEASFGTNVIGVFINTTSVAAPTLISLSPTTGPVGTSVTLTGTSFSTATAVSFNGTAATSFTVNSATSITATVPAGATTGNVTVTTAGGTSNGVNFTVALADLVVSTGTQLSPTVIPAGSYNSITITGTGNAVLAGNVSVAAFLTVQAGGGLSDGCAIISGAGSFTLAAGTTLGICSPAGISASGATGSVQVTGTRSYSADASYGYTGAAAATGNGLPGQVRNLAINTAGPVALTQAVAVTQAVGVGGAGNLVLNGRVLTLLSSASGTALAVNSGTGIISGNTATVQRYIAPAVNPGLGYRHYSAPVSSSTVADLTTAGFAPVLNPAYNAAAAPGAVTPFPTVFGYDQSRLTLTNTMMPFDKGWFSPAALTDALAVGRGYIANLDAGQLVDFVGTLNTGTQTLALARNSGATAADAGWELVGNPYPAPLDYSLVAPADRLNLDAAVYVFGSTSQYNGQYRTYVNGVGGNPIIPVAQGFFVRVSTGQTSGTLTFRNSQRLTTPNATAFQRTTETRPLVQLELRGATGPADAFYAYAEAGATAGTDAGFDAVKLPNTTGLNLASLGTSAGEALAIDGRPAFTAATALPLTVGVPAAGTYTLTAAALLNLPAGLDAYLSDAATGQTVNLSQQPAYSFSVTSAQAATLISSRFVLRFGARTALATATGLTAAQVSLYPNPAHDSFTVLVPAGTTGSSVQAELLNGLGQVVRRQTAATGARFTVQTQGLAAGVYTLRLAAGATTLAKRVVVQ